MPSAAAEAIVGLYSGWRKRLAANPPMDLATTRAMFEEWHVLTAEPSGVRYDELSVGGVPAIACLPDGGAAERVLLFLHGGAYLVGSMHSHRKLVGHLARAAGVRALALDYRRAPEHPFPAPISDGVAAYRWLVGQGIRPEHVAVGGDSAGGTLALAIALQLRELGLPAPAGVVALSPWLDVECTDDTFRTRAAGDLLWNPAALNQSLHAYLGGASRRDPLVDPLLADLTGLPPVYLAVGGAEVLVGPAANLTTLAEKAGVAVALDIEPGMQHVFQFMAGKAPEADRSVAAIGTWLRARLGLG